MDHKFMALIELNNGFKCEGIITSVDKVNMKIIMTNVTRYSSDFLEKIRKEFLPELIIDKNDIKEVNKISYDHNSNTMTHYKPNFSLTGHKKNYISVSNEGFFDNLEVLTHDEAAYEKYKYNEKNRETFFSKRWFSNPIYRGGGYKKSLNFQQKSFYSPDYDYYGYSYQNQYKNHYNSNQYSNFKNHYTNYNDTKYYGNDTKYYGNRSYY